MSGTVFLPPINADQIKEVAKMAKEYKALAQSLADALEGIIDEVPNSVEYSDWPELQELVEQARAALTNYRKGE